MFLLFYGTFTGDILEEVDESLIPETLVQRLQEEK